MSRLLRLVVLASLAALAGCRPKNPPPATQPVTTQPVAGDPTVQLIIPGQPAGNYLDIYQVAVPFGAVSRSADFWRRVDEEKFPPPVKDLLLKNGLRVGLAASEDWDYFRSLIEQHPHVSRSGSAVASGRGEVELEMRKNVMEQDIFVLTTENKLIGRTYDYCADLFGVSFGPDPRRRNDMRVKISPVVRSLRYRLEYSPLNEERVFREYLPESIYDLDLQANIPADRFMILALSELGDRRTSLGNQFLTLDGIDRQEQLLIFVPRLANRPAPAATQKAQIIDAAGR